MYRVKYTVEVKGEMLTGNRGGPIKAKKTVAEETENLISMLLRQADIGMSSVKCIETKAKRTDTAD